MEEFFKNIANFGFPIVITMYLLLRFESKIDTLSKSVSILNVSVLSKGKIDIRRDEDK